MGLNRLIRQWEEGIDDCKEEKPKIQSAPEIDDMMPVRRVTSEECISSATNTYGIEEPKCTWTAIAVYARHNGWVAKTYISECGHELSDMDRPKYCCKCGKLIKKLGE